MSFSAPSALSIDGSTLVVGIVAARFNGDLVEALLAQVTGHLANAGVRGENITVARVPGSNELPVAAAWLAARAPDVVIALGVLIRGDTIHYQLVADHAGHGLQRVALDAGLPVINGIVVAETRAQAEARCRGEVDRGAEFAHAALEMAALKRRFCNPSQS